MNIYIDFDGTIFDINKLNKDFINLFKNIDKDYISYLITKHKNYDIVANILIKEFNLNTNIINEVNNLYQNNYTYPDAITFLEKYYKKYNLILLTYAKSLDYQKKKIKSAKINKYFKDIIITTIDKSKLNINYINNIFIDNNPKELKKLIDINAKYIIRINHKNDHYNEIKLDVKTIPEYKDFIELINNKHLEKIGENNNE